MRRSNGPEFEISRHISPLAGAATYRAQDYSLSYKPACSVAEANAIRAANGAWRQDGRRLFLMAGFWTLTFEGVPSTVTELDGYTNDAQWKAREIRVPEPVGTGGLVLIGDELADDRVTFGGEPSVEFDHSRAAIRIVFMEGQGRQFRIGTDFYACISDRRLASITLTRVLFT